MTGAEVLALTDKPSGELILERPAPRFHPLIRLRADFAAELRGSVRDVE